MAKSNEEILLMFRRIKLSVDGAAFIDYLNELSKQNYAAFKRCDSELNDVHKGYAFCVDNLIECFRKCDERKEETKEDVDWT